jgi:hypothetical protein
MPQTPNTRTDLEFLQNLEYKKIVYANHVPTVGFRFDKDYQWLFDKFNWLVDRDIDGRPIRVYCHIQVTKNKAIEFGFAAVVLGLDRRKGVVYKNSNPLDCRLSNLSGVVVPVKNKRQITYVAHLSGNREKSWVARRFHLGKVIYLGIYLTKDEAMEVAMKWTAPING